MSDQRAPVIAAAHHCPSCHEPQTKITRVLAGGKLGSSNFVCARAACALGIDVSKLVTWIAADGIGRTGT